MLASTISQARQALAAQTDDVVLLFSHGSLEVEYYSPKGVDNQTPHRRDEIYVITSGTGTFNHAGTRIAFAPGDVLFAAAGVEHRFEDFSDDFGTWVFFYGPDGGEKAAS